MRLWVERTLIALLRVYQRVFSPFLPPLCRFHPSCSQYWIEALEEWGIWRGSWMGLRRLLRCHPAGPGGLDPVPRR